MKKQNKIKSKRRCSNSIRVHSSLVFFCLENYVKQEFEVEHIKTKRRWVNIKPLKINHMSLHLPRSTSIQCLFLVHMAKESLITLYPREFIFSLTLFWSKPYFLTSSFNSYHDGTTKVIISLYKMNREVKNRFSISMAHEIRYKYTHYTATNKTFADEILK